MKEIATTLSLKENDLSRQSKYHVLFIYKEYDTKISFPAT